MRSLITNYTFNKSAKQVTFTDFPSIKIENVLLITVVSGTNAGLMIYQANNPDKGGAVSGNVLTLDYDTTGAGFDNSDKLQIFYEGVDSSVVSGAVDVVSVPAPLNVTGSGAASSALRVQLADESLSALENINVTVSNSAVEITNDAGNPIPVNGTVAATQSGTWSVQNLDGVGNALASATTTPGAADRGLVVRNIPSGTQAVSASSLPLPSGAATSAAQTNGTQRTRITDGTNNAALASAAPTGTEQALVVRNIPSGTQTISGTVTANTGLDQPLTDAQLRASAVPVSGTVSVNPLPAGNNNIGDVDVASLPAPLNVTGSGAAASALRVQLADESLSALENINNTVTVKADTLANQVNALKVDGSAVTQPISGSVSISGTPSVSVSNFPATQTVSGTVAISNTLLKNVPGTLDNDWTTVKTYASDTTSPLFNTRPASEDFSSVSGWNAGSQIIYVLPKVKTDPAASITQHVWVDDGTDVYQIVAGTTYAAKLNGLSAFDAVSAYDGAAVAAITVNRFTPTIKIAVNLIVNPATWTYVVNNTSTATITAPTGVLNSGLAGGELVRLTSASQLPIGLSGTIASIDTSADTITFSDVQFADTEEVRVNLIQLPTTGVPPLGICGLVRCANIDVAGNWFTLDAGYNLNLQRGDVVRVRPGAGSTLPSLAGTALATTTSYVVSEVSGQNFRLTLSTHGSATFNITSPGIGIFFIFKYPYVDLFMKGTNQLSLTSGGAAIDFKRLHDAAAVTVTAGTAATITQVGHGYAAGKEVYMTATTIPVGAFQGQKFYVTNPATDTYNLSLSVGGPAVAFTSAGTAVQIVDPVTNTATSVTVTAGTPASITLPTHWLGAGSDFILGGTTLPTGYTGQSLYVVTSTQNTFTFSENRITPCVFGSAGTAVTLSTIPGRNVDITFERRTAYIANTPAPTDTTLSFAYTSGGPAITLIGGSGAQTFTLATAPKIKAGSLVRVRTL